MSAYNPFYEILKFSVFLTVGFGANVYPHFAFNHLSSSVNIYPITFG